MIRFLFIIQLILSIVSCEKDDDVKDYSTPSLELSSLSLDFESKNQTKEVIVESMSSDQLKIYVDSESMLWCSTYFNNDVISVSVIKNDGVDIREADITIACDGLFKNIKIRQLGQKKMILVDPSEFSVKNVASEISFKITANVDYEISTPKWVKKESQTRVECKDYIYYVDSSNEMYRTGEILIKELGGTTQNKITIGQKSDEIQQLKVIAWNTWHGGHSKLLPSYGCKGTLGILKESDADVILMVETYGSSAKVAEYLGYDHRLLSSNLSIYSKYPITNTYIFSNSISTSNFGGVEININGTKVRLFDTWLHYSPDCRTVPTDKSEQEILEWENSGSRDDEIRAILNVLKPFIAESDEIPIIIGGDFNIHSHLDWTEETKDMYNHGGAVVNWTVSKEMENAGFKDSFREINPDPVKNIGTTWIHPVNEDWEARRSAMERIGQRIPYEESEILRYDRIDFIYYQGDKLKATESKIYNKDIGEMLLLKGEDFFFASDHGLVLTSFDIIPFK